MNKHPNCAERCQLVEDKGYRPCAGDCYYARMSDTPRTDEVHRVAMSLVVGDDYSMAHDEMLQHARGLERELYAALSAGSDLRDSVVKITAQLNATEIVAGVASKERGEWAAEREALKQGLGSSVAVYRAALVRAGRIARDVLAEWTDPVSAESIGNAIAQRLKSEDEPR